MALLIYTFIGLIHVAPNGDLTMMTRMKIVGGRTARTLHSVEKASLNGVCASWSDV